LLLQHLRLAATDGAPFHELCQVLPNLSADQIRYRLRLLRDAGKVRSEGRGRAARWYLTSP
jgi:DNA-binding transcriptional ArsR family regulator